MAWVNFTTPEVIGDAYDTYGTVKLQYDNSSVGSTRSCRLYFELDQGKTVYIYFRNVDIDGSEVQSQILVTGSMTIWSGTLSANASHSYYFCCPWYTGTTCYGSSGTLPTGYVAPTTPTISATISGTTATVTYGTTSFGNPSTGTVTLYGGTATAPTTSIDTTNTTGNKTFSHTGLTPGTTYYYRARANNGQLSSNYSTEVSITVPVSSPIKLYGSANNQTEEVEKFYGSVQKVSSLNATTLGQYIRSYNKNLFLVALETYAPEWLYKKPYTIRVRSQSGISYLEISRRSGISTLYTILVDHVTEAILGEWGITLSTTLPFPSGSSSIISLNPSYTNVSKKIIKFYGSANGQTKLIYSA